MENNYNHIKNLLEVGDYILEGYAHSNFETKTVYFMLFQLESIIDQYRTFMPAGLSVEFPENKTEIENRLNLLRAKIKEIRTQLTEKEILEYSKVFAENMVEYYK